MHDLSNSLETEFYEKLVSFALILQNWKFLFFIIFRYEKSRLLKLNVCCPMLISSVSSFSYSFLFEFLRYIELSN